MRHGSAACNAIGAGLRFLTATNRLLMLPSEGTNGGASVFTVFISEQVVLGFCVFCAGEPVRRCLERDPRDDSISCR